SDQSTKIAFPAAVEAALATGGRARADELLESIEALPPGRLAPLLRGHASRFRARLAAADGDTQKAESRFFAAASTFREFGMPYWLAVTLLEQGEWLVSEGRAADAEPTLTEAREILERLKATRWLERMSAVAPSPRHEVPA